MKLKFTFGIYPGGTVGTDSSPELTSAQPDVPEKIMNALDLLQGTSREFWVRCYMGYHGEGRSKNNVPRDPEYYAAKRRKLDLVIGYQSAREDISGYEAFIRAQVRRFGRHLAKIQITEEPNLRGIPVVDGDVPGVMTALTNGVIAAKEEAMQLGLAILVGFNAVPSFDVQDDFWRKLATQATPKFYQSLDYVGLDFFPDVFRAVPLENMAAAVGAVLNQFRNCNLKEAGIANSIPIHITENGWPTSPERPEEKQAKVLQEIVRTIYGESRALNIQGYELFSLRDSDSSREDIFYQFGIMRDDYSPKAAFNVFRDLIATLSA